MGQVVHKILRPEHYAHGEIECIDYILDKNFGFCEGNVIKYVTRAGKKESSSRLEDLKKARQYLDFLIDQIEE